MFLNRHLKSVVERIICRGLLRWNIFIFQVRILKTNIPNNFPNVLLFVFLFRYCLSFSGAQLVLLQHQIKSNLFSVMNIFWPPRPPLHTYATKLRGCWLSSAFIPSNFPQFFHQKAQLLSSFLAILPFLTKTTKSQHQIKNYPSTLME